LVEHASSTAREIAEVESILMRFAMDSSNVGFSFGISDSIPNSLMLPKPPTESLKFINVDFVGTNTSNQTQISPIQVAPLLHLKWALL
jgi:hypothetical protein